MLSTFFGIQIGQSGLEAAQTGEDVVGQNIANAATPGYSEETANLTENQSVGIPSVSDRVHAGTNRSGSQCREHYTGAGSIFRRASAGCAIFAILSIFAV